MVEFFDPKCSSCQAFKPTWDQLPRMAWKEPLRFRALSIEDASNLALASKLGVLEQGLPNVQLFVAPPFLRGEARRGAHVPRMTPRRFAVVSPELEADGSISAGAIHARVEALVAEVRSQHGEPTAVDDERIATGVWDSDGDSATEDGDDRTGESL